MLLLIWHGRPSTLDLDWRFAVVGLTVIGAVAVTLWAFRRFSPSICSVPSAISWSSLPGWPR